MSLLRNIILKASQSATLRERAPRLGFVRRTAGRFLPGEDADAALTAARSLAQNGILTLLTHLGENVASREEATAVTNQYLDLIARARTAELPSEISVKLTQLGLDLDKEFCFANLVKLIESSAADPAASKTLWIDMEQSPYIDVTLDLYGRARRAFRNVGVCVQAYLYRTEKDVASLIAAGATVRLVKGAYNEPAEIAFPKKSDVDESYFRLAQLLLGPQARAAGVRAAMATHDRPLIARIIDWSAAQKIPKGELEFAMLYGIRRAEQLRLAREGYRTCVLVSYGSYWFPWFMRRLAERPANAWFLARNLFS
ncbi:MAG TPA: proline dehydrogenase family protein [Candidatus Acidoferrales bacterium]|jgi:proline dehydrogenase|nr:proline dehydrogenase family protein [Candidatus Acidoferrales bacterium]